MDMETREVMIEIPTKAAIITLKCFDATGAFFAESMSIIAEEEEEEKAEEEKEETAE